MLTKSEYSKALKNGVYEVCFKKKDGTFRIMKCTLMSALIPKTLNEVTDDVLLKPKRKENPDVLSVFDLEKNSWRSFRIESVATFKEISIR